jgi:hypothetical protein
MLRAMYKGERGFQRYVGWSVITKNLFSIARWQERRKMKKAQRKSDVPIGGMQCAASQAAE